MRARPPTAAPTPTRRRRRTDSGFVLLSCDLEQHATLSTTTTTDLAERIIGTLRAHEAELRRAGIRRLSLFGSAARGDADAASDIDLAAEFDPAARMDLFRLTALEHRLGEILGRRVDLLPEPVDKPRLRVNIDRDRQRAF
jgi:predicted nucleotidyltransferase